MNVHLALLALGLGGGLPRLSRVASPTPLMAIARSGAASLETWGLRPRILDSSDEFASRASVLSVSPPAFAIDDFLSAEECAAVIELAKAERAAGTGESDLYLNYRVNKEVGGAQESSEARKLIEEQALPSAQLSASAPSGFRVHMGPLGSAFEAADGTLAPAAPGATSTQALGAELGARVLRLLGLPHRRLRLADGIWVKPDRRYVVVRDVTVVHYREGEGVAPHVDGKDATLLIYLNSVPQGAGGRTVFVEDGFASRPMRGRALLYWSKGELLHYSEAITQGEKWVMQLLIDFRHTDTGSGPYVDFATGKVIRGI